MEPFQGIFAVTLASGVAIGCAAPTTVAPFRVVVRGPAEACSLEVEGRKLATEQLLEIARVEAKPGRRARIDLDTPETPWQCVGGVIYTLQKAGFRDVGFNAEPLPQR